MREHIDRKGSPEYIKKGLTKKEISFLNYILSNKHKTAPMNKIIENTHGSLNKNE